MLWEVRGGDEDAEAETGKREEKRRGKKEGD